MREREKTELSHLQCIWNNAKCDNNVWILPNFSLKQAVKITTAAIIIHSYNNNNNNNNNNDRLTAFDQGQPG